MRSNQLSYLAILCLPKTFDKSRKDDAKVISISENANAGHIFTRFFENPPQRETPGNQLRRMDNMVTGWEKKQKILNLYAGGTI